MFTGIIKGLGRVAEMREVGGDLRIALDAGAADLGALLGPLALGDSVAVNGVCLTVVALEAGGFAADVSRETLSLTSLANCEVGTQVNLEPALRAGEPLGGHLVSGHVDGLARLESDTEDARSHRLRFSAPANLRRFIASKGSVTLDGISLTVNNVDASGFEVNIVPHTLAVTNLGQRVVGDHVNLEVDMLARYVDQRLQAQQPETR
jgi:riboflavin synthase